MRICELARLASWPSEKPWGNSATNSAMAFSGFDCDSTMMVLAFQSLPNRSIPADRSDLATLISET
jgi:hypothetical protein